MKNWDPSGLNCIEYRYPFTGSGFNVQGKNKEGIENPKSSLKMFIFPSNCQLGSKFWIRPDEDDAFVVNTYSQFSPGTRMEP